MYRSTPYLPYAASFRPNSSHRTVIFITASSPRQLEAARDKFLEHLSNVVLLRRCLDLAQSTCPVTAEWILVLECICPSC